VILVGGGSIIIGDSIAGVRTVVRPAYFEVANAVGAAVSRRIPNALSVHSYLIDW
jgi:hypothetical protein